MPWSRQWWSSSFCCRLIIIHAEGPWRTPKTNFEYIHNNYLLNVAWSTFVWCPANIRFNCSWTSLDARFEGERWSFRRVRAPAVSPAIRCRGSRRFASTRRWIRRPSRSARGWVDVLIHFAQLHTIIHTYSRQSILTFLQQEYRALRRFIHLDRSWAMVARSCHLSPYTSASVSSELIPKGVPNTRFQWLHILCKRMSYKIKTK